MVEARARRVAHHQSEDGQWDPIVIFWFNKDSRLSIASVSIPYGQRFITIDIETQNNILFTAPGNLFLKLTTETQTSADGVTKGLPTAVAVTDVKKYITLTPTLATNSNIDTTQQISNMELYINNIFVNPEINTRSTLPPAVYREWVGACRCIASQRSAA
jgi:hypothetical protein